MFILIPITITYVNRIFAMQIYYLGVPAMKMTRKTDVNTDPYCSRYFVENHKFLHTLIKYMIFIEQYSLLTFPFAVFTFFFYTSIIKCNANSNNDVEGNDYMRLSERQSLSLKAGGTDEIEKSIEVLSKSMEKKVISDELKQFNSITMLNWAWQYKNSSDQWVQFDCVVCMILESKW